ncbi:MAG: M20/M25/M40 family metallo-hydrolase [Anaerolineales bacterium]|nr:M20/M25/M40 family metallo-hydrolase [Anaerolineales bacterium]
MPAELIEKIVQKAIQIQQIPAPTFEEKRRAQFVQDGFVAEGLSQVEMDGDGNVFACLPGADSDHLPLVVTAHTDTVFPAGTDLSVTRENGKVHGPGIGDNSLGVAGLYGLVWALREQNIQLQGDLWLAANIGEEGLGDLKGMKAVYERFGNQALGYLVLEGLALGRIYNRGLGVRRYRISVETVGGHSWVDYGNPSAIHELVLLTSQILGLRTPQRARTSMNVGKISGGVSINTIAPHALLELDLRSESGRVLNNLARKVEGLVRVAEHPGARYTCEVIGDRPFGEVAPADPLVQAGIMALKAQGLEAILEIGSTDANIPLSHGVPAICIGLTTGGGAHTTSEFLEIEPLSKGLAQLLDVVQSAYRNNQLSYA